MPITSSSGDIRSMSDFVRDLFEHQFNTTAFFDKSLLESIAANFGFKNNSILVYGDDHHYLGMVAPTLTDNPTSFIYDCSYRNYYWRNPIFNAINEYCKFNIPDVKQPPLFLSTKIIPLSEYDTSEYANFLKQEYGYYYGLIMPFGINGRFRICIHKLKDENDFTDKELDLIGAAYQVIAAGFDSFNKLTVINTASEVRQSILDEQKIGVILMDKNFAVLKSSPISEEYLMAATNTKTLKEAQVSMLSLLFDTNIVSSKPVVKSVNGYRFSCRSYFKNNYMNNAEWVNCLTILPPTMQNDPEAEDLLSMLSSREMEIVGKIAEGLTYKKTAEILFVSPSTVRNHVHNILSKLGIENQRQLIKLYLNHHRTAVRP
jgi:DNA-binding CsgD family transcriptional regulator